LKKEYIGFDFDVDSAWTAVIALVLVAFVLPGDVWTSLSPALALAALTALTGGFLSALSCVEDDGVGCCLEDLRTDFNFPAAGFGVSS
jgi:hypothetical protein